jgi:hypothetical protein
VRFRVELQLAKMGEEKWEKKALHDFRGNIGEKEVEN